MWYKLADRLGMSLQRCMQETTSTEFLRWKKYMEQDLNEQHRQDYYLAQIAAEIRRSVAKTPAGVKTEDFLIKFVHEGTARPPRSKAELARRTQRSKNAWFGLVGAPRKPPPQKRE